MDLFTGGLGVMMLGCAALHYYTRTTATAIKDANFSKFQQVYLIVYLMAMGNGLNFYYFLQKL